VFEILRDVTPLVEPLSIDEAFLDVSGARRRLGPPTRIGAGLRQRIRAEYGITGSVGIAHTKFVAKLASTQAKPDGMLLIPTASTVGFLHSLPVGALWGVGDKTQEVLARWGITTVTELAHTDLAVLQAAVGRVAGRHLYDLSWGRDPRPVQPGTSEHSIGAQSTFGRDTADMSVIEARLLNLSDRCATRLRRHGYVARTVTVTVRTSDFRTVTRSKQLMSVTDVAHEIYLVARDLAATVDVHGLPVRLVGVRAQGLAKRQEAPLQATLEESVTARIATRRQAEAAVDDIRERFGARSIALGPVRGRLTSTTRQVDLF
jgi:DNA polymerase-4